MKNCLLLLLTLATLVSGAAPKSTAKAASKSTAKAAAKIPAVPPIKRDLATIKKSLIEVVGEETLKNIKKKEGGEAFLKAFLSDQAWMEQFLCSGRPGTNMGDKKRCGSWAKSLEALDLLYYNNKGDYLNKSKIGKHIANSFALNHGHDWDDEKLVQYMECYREWDKDGTLDDSCYDLDTWGWREITNMGQNAELDVENLRWIHDYANVPPPRHYAVCHQAMAYRLFNCFGASVHGRMYYQPWEHRWNTQQLRFRVGGVCGAISKFGAGCAAAHGIRAYTAGQPGHCAYMVWDFSVNHWGLGNAVTSHTNPTFSLGGSQSLAANEEQCRYYTNPRRIDAEYYRLKGDYLSAMRCVTGNWNAGHDWADKLEAGPSSKEEWDKYGAAVRETFALDPSQGWQLYFKYLSAIKDRKDQIEAAKEGLLTFTENDHHTFEAMYFDERVMDPLFKILGDGDDAVWKLLPVALDGQAGSKNYYPAIVNWGAEKLMKGPEGTRRFLKAVAASSKKHNRDLDYTGMILSAAQQGDLMMFKQVYKVMDKLSPDLAPKKEGKNYPDKDYGDHPLVSCDGLMRISKTGGYDTPVRYRNVLNAEEFQGGNGFHTDKDEEPYMEILLPGEVEIAGITIVNSGSNGNNARQVPLEVSISGGDGHWTKIWSSNDVKDVWRVQLPRLSPACKLVRVGRAKGREEVFHLHKVMVYGRKLY